VLDLDAEWDRLNPSVGDAGAHDSVEYYEGSLAILREWVERQRLIVALGGGTLINSTVAADGCDATVATCKARGKLVLLLPSRFDFINRRKLLEREKKRMYFRPKDADHKRQLENFFKTQYSDRIAFFRRIADLTVTGDAPQASAKTIIKKLGLKS
jgi:shikimate kinase